MIIVLRPNGSLRRSQAKLFFCCMVALSALIAGGFASVGAWPVLPFAGLEMLVLAYGLREALYYSDQQEVIRITTATVVIELGRYRPERCYEFPRRAVRLTSEPPARLLDPRRLAVCCGSHEVEIGGFLIEQEKNELIHLLVRVLDDV